MMNIVEVAKQKFSNETIEIIASKLNEKSNHIKKVVDVGISMIYLSLLLKIEQNRLWNILGPEQKRFKIKDLDLNSNTIFDVEMSNPSKGIVGAYGNLLPLLFEDETDTFIDNLSGYSKIKSISGHHMLAAISALVLSLINRNYAKSHEKDIRTFLLNQKQNILNSLPQDALFYEIIDFSEIKELQERKNLKNRILEKVVGTKAYEPKKYWVLYFLLLLLLLNLFWIIYKK